jgi:protein adenylyltransferase
LKLINKLNFTNTFVKMGPELYQLKFPDPVTEPYLVDFSPEVAKLIGLDPADAERPEFVEFCSGNKLPPGAQPLAMAYSGHQFGSYNPRLGDGRGLLLGEVTNGNGQKWDIHLKGAGPTRFARGFDGRATLRATIREYLAGEALHGLNIPTTRSLAIIGIRELIYRQTPELAAILVRISDSHIRFGSFELFHYTNNPEKVTELADYVIHNHHPDIENEADKYQLLFRRVMTATAHMIAKWQAAGFVHGVMNTDNMCITGVTFDYGPYGFIDHFNPNYTPNTSDHSGRYALGKQAEIGYWNLSKWGETLCRLVDPENIMEELAQYQTTYNNFYRELMGQKLGLAIHDEEFTTLIGSLFQLLYKNPVDYTNFFRALSDYPEGNFQGLIHAFDTPKEIEDWLDRYRKLIEREDVDFEERKATMDGVNPKFILRQYLLQRAIDKALKESDFSEIQRLRVLLEDPFKDRPEIFKEYDIDPEFYAADTPDTQLGMQLSCSA